MKKTLKTILLERADTIEYRSIKAQLMKIAQNKGRLMMRIHLEPKTIIKLQNEGLTVDKIKEYGTEKYKISW